MPVAIRCGIKILDYWELTIGEIKIYIDAFYDNKKKDYQEKVYLSYQTSLLTSLFVNNGLNGKKNPSFEELFPQLLTEEDREAIRKQEIESYKMKWKAFMDVHNNQRKEK